MKKLPILGIFFHKTAFERSCCKLHHKRNRTLD